MPFRFRNEPATFQRALDIIITKCKWQTFLIYLEDAIIYSKMVDKRKKNVEEILT